VLADAGLDASEIVASCFLLRFLAPATRIEIAELIASAKFPKKSQQSSALASKYESSKNKAEGHLVPSSLRFVDNEDSDAILATLEAYLQVRCEKGTTQKKEKTNQSTTSPICRFCCWVFKVSERMQWWTRLSPTAVVLVSICSCIWTVLCKVSFRKP
jgi:hypothetical protein